MASAYGVTTIVSSTTIPPGAVPSLSVKAAAAGIPVILEELIDGKNISEPSTSAGVRGILNIMKTTGMIDGAQENQQGFPSIPGINRFWGILRPQHGGIAEILHAPGELIAKGSPVIRIRNLFGDTVEDVVMPVNGYTWACPLGDALGTSGGLQTVQTGANVAYVFVNESR
jgi:predicted deacylase